MMFMKANCWFNDVEQYFVLIQCKELIFLESKNDWVEVSTLFWALQLRNLVWSTTKHDVYLMSHFSIVHWSSLSCKKTEVLNVSGHVAPCEVNLTKFYVKLEGVLLDPTPPSPPRTKKKKKTDTQTCKRKRYFLIRTVIFIIFFLGTLCSFIETPWEPLGRIYSNSS